MRFFLQAPKKVVLPDEALIIIASTFLILFLAAVLLFILFTQQKKKAERQQAIENIRSRISKDIHDEIGSGLTKISLISQRLKNSFKNKEETDITLLDKISNSSKEVIENLGEIIWTVNPKHDNLTSLLAYIRNYCAIFFEDTSIKCIIDFPDNIPSLPIHPELKRNLFLVIKECLNNIIKHASATEVIICFNIYNEQYSLVIIDNGRGMDNPAGREFGNGLSNMSARMKAVNGTFEIFSEVNKGTKINVSGKVYF